MPRWELPPECADVVGQLDLKDQITQYKIEGNTIYVRQTNCHVVSPITTYRMVDPPTPDPIPVPEPDTTLSLVLLLIAIIVLWRVGPLR